MNDSAESHFHYIKLSQKNQDVKEDPQTEVFKEKGGNTEHLQDCRR